MDTTTREAEAIVRTSVNRIANVAHLKTYQQNKDVASKVEFVAVLDSRTTLICASHDGETFGVEDEGLPTPPLHINCRSVLTPVIDWEALGIDPPAEGTRASAGGQVKASTTYEDWLRNQPHGVQDEILGRGRAKLFREGKATLRDMVRSDGGIVRLDELKGAA